MAPIQVSTNHQISSLLQDKKYLWLSDSRLLKHQALLLENSNIAIYICGTLNWATLLPSLVEDTPFHSCQETLFLSSRPRADLTDQPLENPDNIWFTDESSFMAAGKWRAGYSVVSFYNVIEVQLQPTNTSTQLAELIVLTRAIELAKGERVTIYIDSKYTFLVLPAHAVI